MESSRRSPALPVNTTPTLLMSMTMNAAVIGCQANATIPAYRETARRSCRVNSPLATINPISMHSSTTTTGINRSRATECSDRCAQNIRERIIRPMEAPMARTGSRASGGPWRELRTDADDLAEPVAQIRVRLGDDANERSDTERAHRSHNCLLMLVPSSTSVAVAAGSRRGWFATNPTSL